MTERAKAPVRPPRTRRPASAAPPGTTTPPDDPYGARQAAYGNGFVTHIVFADPLMVTPGVPPQPDTGRRPPEAPLVTVDGAVISFAPIVIEGTPPAGPLPDEEPELAEEEEREAEDMAAEPAGAAPEGADAEPLPGEEGEPAVGDELDEHATAGAPAEDEEAKTEEAGDEPEAAKEDAEAADEAATEIEAKLAPGEAESGAEPAAEAEPAEERPGGAGGEAKDLAAWRAKVGGATSAAPRPSLGGAGAEGAKRVVRIGAKASAKRGGKRAPLVESAQKARKKPPDPGKPLPAPPPTPVPEADRKIDDASNKRLPKQTLPPLVRRPAGTPAGFGEGAVPDLDANLAGEMGTSVSITPAEPEGAEAKVAPGAEKNPNKEATDKIDEAGKKEPDAARRAKAGEVLTLEDTAPLPSPGGEVGTKGVSKEKVAGVLAEIARSAEPEAEKITKEARKEAYPKEALFHEYPEIAKDLKDEVKSDIEAKVDSLRKVAGLSQEELNRAIVERKTGVKTQRDAAMGEIDAAKGKAREDVETSGETHADDIASAKEAVDTDTVRQLTAVNGEADPEVIKLRRDQALTSLARRAARQDIFYEKSGERRQKALDAMTIRYRNAYANAAQADHKAHVETVTKRLVEEEQKPPAEAAVAAQTEARTATEPIFKWAALRNREAAAAITAIKTATTKATEALRTGIKSALEAARELVRDWASDKIAEQESWWDKILNLFREWAQDAQDDSAAWEEARNQALRDDMVSDFALLDEIQTAAREGVDVKTFVEERGLDETQAAIVGAYFRGAAEGTPDAIGAVAVGMRMRIRGDRKPKLIETLRKRVMDKPAGEWRKTARIADAERSPFNVVAIGSKLYRAMDQWGTEEADIYAALAGLTPLQAKVLRDYYRQRYGISLDEHLADELSGAEKTRADALLEGNQTLADVATLHEAMHGGLTGAGTDEDTIMNVLRGKSAEERAAIVAEYQRQYGRDLEADLKDELDDGWSSHHDIERANALMEGDTAKADAIALDQAMHGGWTGAGSDEAAITQVYEQTRREVEAEAARNGWSTEQMNKEIARRNAQIEKEYEGRYGDPKRAPGATSALKKALADELSHAELDLALALADNDPLKANIARLEVERTSFITDDDVVIGVIEAQRKRAEKDVRRDSAYDLNMRADIDTMRGEPWDQKRWAKERAETDARMAEEIKKRSKLYMGNLESAYDEKYSRFGSGGLQVLIAFNMSGNERTKARDLLVGGGYLEPAQEIFYAVNGPGTDVDDLKRILKDKSPDEIRKIKADWKERYPNEPDLETRIFEEVSGRDYKDMQWALEGEPQTLDEKLARAKERLDYEKDAYLLGDVFSEDEKAAMEEEYRYLSEEKKRLETFRTKEEPKQKPGESSEDFAIRLEEHESERAYLERSFELQSGYFDQTVEDHRAAVDSLADTASSIAAIVATVVVIVVAAVLTGGTAGAAIVAALASAKVAAASAAAAAAATVGTKLLIKGSAVSHQELAVDAAVGVVDAAASYLTAGMGGALLKTLKPGAKVSRLTAFVGRSKAATQLAKAAASDRTATRVFANALAEGVEGIASSLPSALTGNVLREENWVKGNPLANILTGTMIETGIGVGLSGGLGGLGGLGKHADEVADALPPTRAGLADELAGTGDVLARRGTPAERLASWKTWEAANPGRSYNDFLKELDAGLIAKEADEAAARAVQREMRTELLSGVPPAQRGQLADVPIEVMSDADFERFTRSKSARAVVIFEDGKPRVILREGADAKALREEGIHLLQSRDPKFMKKFARLDETRLANWDEMGLEQKFALYRDKLDIEIDAQKRLIKGLDDELAGTTDPALRRRLLAQRRAASMNLDNLAARLDEVEGLTPTQRARMAKGELDPPDFLDQKPRLFQKAAADADGDIALDIAAAKARIEAATQEMKKLAKALDDLAAGSADSRAAKLSGRADAAWETYRRRLDRWRRAVEQAAAADELPEGLVDPTRGADLFAARLRNLAESNDLDGLEALLGDVERLLDFKRALPAQRFAGFVEIAAPLDPRTGLLETLARLKRAGVFRNRELPKLEALARQVLGEKGAKALDDLAERIDELTELSKARDILKGSKAELAQESLDGALDKLRRDAARFGLTDEALEPVLEEFSRTGRFHWPTFKSTLSEKHNLAGEEFKELREMLESVREKIEKKAPGTWIDEDIGPLLHWGKTLKHLHESLGEEGGAGLLARLRRLLLEGDTAKRRPQALLPDLKQSGYDAYRTLIKDEAIDHVMRAAGAAEQIGRMRAIMKHLREEGADSASIGEYFAAFRRRLFKSGEASPLQGELAGAVEITDAGRKIAGGDGTMVDGVLRVPSVREGGHGPKQAGLYAMEDKAGKSFDLDQAINYSKKLEEPPPGSLGMEGGDPCKGLIYICESAKHAVDIANKLDGQKPPLSPNIMVATFRGSPPELKFVPRRKIPVVPED